MRDAEPGNAIELEHGGSTPGLAREADEPRRGENAEVRDQHDVPLFFGEENRICCIAQSHRESATMSTCALRTLTIEVVRPFWIAFLPGDIVH